MIRRAEDDESIWTKFAGNSLTLPSSSPLKEYLSAKTLLITGAGGSIGSALARFAIACKPEALILLDSSEYSLHALERSLDLSSKAVCVPVLGSICDSVLLSELFELYHPQIVLHAAACKHVPLMELNPIAATSTNVLGTFALLQAASSYGAAQFIMVSTDKAVLPISIMGATKRLAELLMLTHPNKALKRKAVRLGNVLGSSGSVGPLFLEQITKGGPVTITHSDARRFFLTLNHAITLLITALSQEYETGILIPDLGPARTVEELARYLIGATASNQEGIEIVFTGLRPGDKVEELLASPYEGCLLHGSDLFPRVQPERLATATLYAILEPIKRSVQQRDLRLLLESICKAVPEYRPSRALWQVVENERPADLCK